MTSCPFLGALFSVPSSPCASDVQGTLTVSHASPGIINRLYDSTAKAGESGGTGAAGSAGLVLASIRRDSTIQVLCTVLGMGCSFALYSLMGHFLGPSPLGVWAATSAACSMVFAFGSLGVDAIACREMAKAPEDSGRIFGSALAMRLTVTFPLVIILTVVLIGSLRLPRTFWQFAVTYVAYAGLATLSGLIGKAFQARQRFGLQLVPILFYGLLSILVIFPMLAKGRGITSVVTATAAGQFLGVVVGLSLLRRLVEIRPRWIWSEWKWLLRESYPLAISMPFLAAYVRIDSVMLAAMKGTASVGLYNSGYTILMACGGLMAAVQSAIFPSLSRLYAESREAAHYVFLRGLRWMALAGTFVFGLSLVAPRMILRLLFGPKFLQAVFSFQVLMLAALFLFLNNTCGIALTAVGQQRWAPRITIAGLGLNVILNLLLIPRLDYLGSSYATLATEIFVLVFAYLALRPHWRRVTTPVLKLTRAADPE